MSEERALYKASCTESAPPTLLTCKNCMYEFNATDTQCPVCRLLDACQGIVNQADWDAILHHGQWAIIDPNLTLEMARALLEIKRSSSAQK